MGIEQVQRFACDNCRIVSTSADLPEHWYWLGLSEDAEGSFEDMLGEPVLLCGTCWQLVQSVLTKVKLWI